MTTTIHYEPGRFGVPGAWDSVSCRLCPHECTIHPSQTGICGVRRNRDGGLVLEQYGRVSHAGAVPSDHLPLYQFKPSRNWLLLGSRGCTMRCPFCNTFRYSQTGAARTRRLSPTEAVELAQAEGCSGISFGVSEPAPIHEFVADTFSAAREAGLDTHVATGGMWCTGPFREILAQTSAVTFGLKSLDETFLQTVLGASRGVLLENIEVVLALGVHLEITWLPLPRRGELPGALEPLTAIFANHGMKGCPLVLLPYKPDFIWAKEGTGEAQERGELEELLRAVRPHWPGPVYVHHPESAHCNTRCPKCDRTLIRRGVTGLLISAEGDACPGCGEPVPWVS